MHPEDPKKPVLSICLYCRDGREARDTGPGRHGGRRLAREVAAAFDAADCGVALREVNCMSRCTRPCTIALSGPGRLTCLFGDLGPTRRADDVLAAAVAHAVAENGFLYRSARPEALRAGILGRIPSIGLAGDLLEPLAAIATRPPTPAEFDDR